MTKVKPIAKATQASSKSLLLSESYHRCITNPRPIRVVGFGFDYPSRHGIGGGGSICDDYVDVSSREFNREIAHTPGASPGPAILDIDSISHDPTEFSQAGDKSGRPQTPDRRVRTEYPDE